MKASKKIIRKELFKNMFFNFILFTLLFTAFGLFIFYQVDKYIYKSVDSQLVETKNMLSEITRENPPTDFKAVRNMDTNEIPEIGINYNENIDTTSVPEFGIVNSLPDSTSITTNENNSSNNTDTEKNTDITKKKEVNLEIESIKREVEMRFGKVGNLRVLAILRDEDGEIIGTSYRNDLFSDFIDSISFNKNNVDKIYDLSINSEIFYRGTVAEIESSSGEKYYVDLLINTNSEADMLYRFSRTLLFATGVGILLSIFISYYLANKSIKPIVKAYEKQSEFIQNASHELRTPLTIIQAKQEMLLQSPNSKIIDKSEDIALTLNETRRLSRMVSELMELARDDANRNLVTRQKTDINALVKEVTIPYKEMALIQEKNLIINTKCNREIEIDRNKFKQLIIILLDNALKYTETGDNIEVEVKNQDDRLFLNVKDTGIGISDEALKHIFERFYREDKARSRAKGGSGLGLSIAQTIVKRHGGSIKIVHNNPKGIIVQVRL